MARRISTNGMNTEDKQRLRYAYQVRIFLHHFSYPKYKTYLYLPLLKLLVSPYFSQLFLMLLTIVLLLISLKTGMGLRMRLACIGQISKFRSLFRFQFRALFVRLPSFSIHHLSSSMPNRSSSYFKIW